MLAKISTDSLLKAVKELVSDNEQEAKLKRVHSEIAKAGAAGIRRTELSRACKFVGTSKAMDDVLYMLDEACMIRTESAGEKGRKALVYYNIAED